VLRKIFTSLFVLLVLAAATVAVLAQADMMTIPWAAMEEFLTDRGNLCVMVIAAAGALVVIVLTIIISSHRAHRKQAVPEPSELDRKVLAEMDEPIPEAAPPVFEETGESEDRPVEPEDSEGAEALAAQQPEEEKEGSEEELGDVEDEMEEEPVATASGFSLKRLRKIAFIALLCFAALLIGIRFIAEPILKHRVLSMIGTRLKASLEIGRSRVSILRGTIQAEDITLTAPPDYKEPITGRIGRANIKMSPLAILFGTCKIHHVELWDLDLRIEIQDQGVNLDTLFQNWVEAREDVKGASMPPPVEIKNTVFHNAKVSIVDADRARLVFDKAEIEAENLTLFKGLPFAVKVKSESTFEGEKGRGTLRVKGTVGPIRKTINLDLALEGKKIDVRDLEVYLGNISTAIGGHIASLDGKFVCNRDQLDGTNLVIKSSGGEVYAVELVGPISDPKMSGPSTVVNILLQPIQKAMRFLRKIFRVEKHDSRDPLRDRDGERDRNR